MLVALPIPWPRGLQDVRKEAAQHDQRPDAVGQRRPAQTKVDSLNMITEQDVPEGRHLN